MNSVVSNLNKEKRSEYPGAAQNGHKFNGIKPQ